MSMHIALDIETTQIISGQYPDIHCVCIGETVYTEQVQIATAIDGALAAGYCFDIHNAKFDISVLRHHGYHLPVGCYFDTLIAAHCVNPQTGMYSLDALTSSKMDYRAAMREAGLWSGADDDPSVYDVPYSDVMYRYVRQDAAATSALGDELRLHLEADPRLADSYYNLHLPFVETMMSLQHGMQLDLLHTITVAARINAEIEARQLAFYAEHPRCLKLRWDAATASYQPKVPHTLGAVNLRSSNDVCSLLLAAGWKPEEFKRDTGRPVTSQAVLGRLVATPGTSPQLAALAAAMSQIKSLLGIQSQLMQALTLCSKSTGVLHPSWHQAGTKTFRLSASKPNAQNWSVRHPVYGKLVRRCFIAPAGHTLLVGDLSQIELAICAWYLEVVCGDSRAAEGNRRGDDAHDTNTLNWFGSVRGDDSFKADRGKAKNGAFATNYSASAKRLSLTLGCSKQEAAEIIRTVEANSEITALKAAVLERTLEYRDVKPMHHNDRDWTRCFLYDCLGTRLFYPKLVSAERHEVASARRQMFNALMQGGSASILRRLCNGSLPHVQAAGGWCSALIHDEAHYVVPTANAEKVLQRLNEVWTSVTLPSPQGGVQIRAEFAIAESWADK